MRSGVGIAALALGLASAAHAAEAQELNGEGSKVGATAMPSRSPAGSASDSSVDEIVVTARRTNESLQSVPVSITAFSGEQLQQQNARSVSDVALLTPGLQINYSTLTTAGTIFTIRGQVNQDPVASQDATVGVYVDGLYWGRAYGANADLLDVSGVQVLKGPQGTLFGRNTTGGAVLLTTNDPNPSRLSGLVSASYGRFNYRSVTGVFKTRR